MKMTLRHLTLGMLGTCALVSTAVPAQNYPVRPIRILVGFQPGGGVDLSARAVGQKLSEALHQSVIVENRPGASGNIASDLAAKAPADGYTLLMSNSTIAMPSLFKKLPFDVNKDLVPLSLVAMGPSLLVCHPSMPVKNVKELIALAKARPGDITYGSGGPGNITHLEMALFNYMSGTKMIHVPYKGGAPSVIGLLSGEVQVLFTSVVSVLQQVHAGKARALAVSTAKRNSALPNVPTVSEAGVPGYDAASWYALFVPAGTPPEAVRLLGKEVVKIMSVREIRRKFAADGFVPVGNSPAEFAKFIRAEIPKWARIIKAANVRAQ